MLINCDNKGCLQQNNALLNPETHEVICQECGKAIKGVSEPMKRTLKSFGQVLRLDERKAFMMACKNCNANREVLLDDKNNTVCRVCKGEIKVHSAMKQAILQVGKKLDAIDSEEQDTEVENTADKPKKVKKSKKNQ
jgi:hypothetical protein